MTTPAPSPSKRSRRIYVYWGIALTLLLTAGLFCWLVVVPVWRVKTIVNEYWRESSTLASRMIANERAVAKAVERLGGEAQAAGKLGLYIHQPDWIAPRKDAVYVLLRHCGRPGAEALIGMLEDRSRGWAFRWQAARALGEMGSEAAIAEPAFVRVEAEVDQELKAGGPKESLTELLVRLKIARVNLRRVRPD